MKLSEAYNLLVEDGVSDNHRYFAELYKSFQFREDQTLKEYLDFIVHEPVHWLRGFPAKLTTKTSFSKPKTAVIKLLKHDTVIQTLGSDYVQKVHDAVWKTYKQHHDTILQERDKSKPTTRMTVVDHFDVESYESLPVPSGPKTVTKPFYTVEKTPPKPISVIDHVDEILEEHEQVIHSEKSTDTAILHQKIRTLKQIIHHLTQHMDHGVSDAFQILLEEL